MVVPASSTSASSTDVASVIVLGESTEAPIAGGPELLTVIGIVVVHVVEGAEWVLPLEHCVGFPEEEGMMQQSSVSISLNF